MFNKIRITFYYIFTIFFKKKYNKIIYIVFYFIFYKYYFYLKYKNEY